jgi:hypothetical protein
MLRRFINGEAIAGGEWKPPASVAAIDRKVDAVRVVGSRAGPRRAMPTAA